MNFDFLRQIPLIFASIQIDGTIQVLQRRTIYIFGFYHLHEIFTAYKCNCTYEWLECEWTNKYVNGIVCQVYGNANCVFVYVEVGCMNKRCRTWMLINWVSAIERRERKKRWNWLRIPVKPSFMLSSSSSLSEFIWKRKCLQIGNAFKCNHLVGRFYTKTTTTIAICVHTNLNLENAMKPRNGNFLVRFLFLFSVDSFFFISCVSFYVEFRLFNCSWQLLHKIKANHSNCSDFCRMNNNITSIFITLCLSFISPNFGFA